MKLIKYLIYYLLISNINKINICLTNFINILSIIDKRKFYLFIFKYINKYINIFYKLRKISITLIIALINIISS